MEIIRQDIKITVKIFNRIFFNFRLNHLKENEW